MDSIKNYLPVIVRYILVSAATALGARGIISGDQGSIISQNMDLLVSAIIGIGTVVYALVKRPSAKALDAAKAIDNKVPASAPVVIQTPAGMDDIVIPGNKI